MSKQHLLPACPDRYPEEPEDTSPYMPGLNALGSRIISHIALLSRRLAPDFIAGLAC